MNASPLSSNLVAPSLHADLKLCLSQAAVIFILSWVPRKFILEPLGRAVLPNDNNNKTQKFAQAVFETILHCIFFSAFLWIVSDHDWVLQPSRWYELFSSGTNALVSPGLRFFYLAYAGRYVSQTASCMMENRRDDFWQMMTHHTSTVALVLLSYFGGYTRIGTAVMGLLDVGDSLLQLAKVSLYCSRDRTDWMQFFADRFFELFAVSFILTRDVVLTYICWTSIYDSRRHFTHDLNTHICNVLLVVIQLLQYFWTTLIIKAAMKMMRGEKLVDSRSPPSPGKEPVGFHLKDKDTDSVSQETVEPETSEIVETVEPEAVEPETSEI